MLIINRTETDPYFNIAAEEYVLKHFQEDIFMLWVNRPSVIIGKHQVAKNDQAAERSDPDEREPIRVAKVGND